MKDQIGLSPVCACRLVIAAAGNITLLGYPVDFSDRQADILYHIAEQYPQSVSVSSIAKAIGVTENSVPVHINDINKKAAAITGRRLVVAKRGQGYTINKYM